MNTTRFAPALCTALVLALAFSSSCSRAAGSASETPATGRPPVAVELVPVALADVTTSIQVVGSLAAKYQADIKSEYSGILSAVYVTEWVHVAKGTPLARLDTRDVLPLLEAAKAAVLQAEVTETRAVRELERAGRLKEYGLVTDQQLDDARSAREAASAAKSAANAQVKAVQTRLEKSLIRSPMDGVVSLRTVNVGDRVENMGGNTPMFRIVDPRLLQATVAVPSNLVARIAVGQPFEFEVDALPGRTFAGRVQFINPAVDPVSRSASVLVDVPNDDAALKSGLFIKGHIVTGTRKDVLQVPRSALVEWDVSTRAGAVFVVQDGLAARRAVSTGEASGGTVEIADGLKPGEQVVSRGAFNLRDGDRVAPSGT